MLLIDDSEIDLKQVEGKLQQLECERDYAREQLAAAHKALMVCDGAMMGKVKPSSVAFKMIGAILRPPAKCQKCGGDGYVVRIVRGPESQAGVAEDCECQSPQNV